MTTLRIRTGLLRTIAAAAVLLATLSTALLTAPALAQPLASDEAAGEQLDADEHARKALAHRFAALAYDAASWQALQNLCPACEFERPDPKLKAAPLPQDPLGPLDLASVQAKTAAQKSRYDAELWQAAGVSLAGLARYESRCLICASQEARDARAQAVGQQIEDWRQQRSACQSAAAPKQYGGRHSWHLDRDQALALCQAAHAAAPTDPWAAYLLWRAQNPDQKDAALLSYATLHAVPPALAAAAWQHLSNHEPARRLASQAAKAGDFNGQVILALLDRRDGTPAAELADRLAPALEADHPWALRLTAALEPSPALKVAYLQLAVQQGDLHAQSQQLRAWEANLDSAGNRKLAARAHILAFAQGLPAALQLWAENGDQRPTRLVKAVQSELIALGHLSGTPDGVWGKNSEAGLRSVSLNEVAAWQTKPAEIQQASLADDGEDPADAAESEVADSALEAASTSARASFDEAGTDDEAVASEGLELADEPQDAAPEESVVATLVAPLPKPKGALAIVEPEKEEAPKPKKRGTIFKRKSD